MERLVKLLNLLNNENSPISSEELASSLKVTSRTIRTDLVEIEKTLENYDIKIIKKRNKGISLSKKLSEEVLIEILQSFADNKDFYLSTERENIIINHLLINNEPISFKKLEELALTSKSSLMKNMANVEKFFDKWAIVISKKPKVGLNLIYSEYNYRQAVVDRLVEYTGKIDYSYLCHKLINDEKFEAVLENHEFINHFLSNVNTMRVANFIKKYEDDNGIKFTDTAFISIIFYICVSETRIREGNKLTNENYALEHFFHSNSIETLLNQFLSGISKQVRYEFNDIELKHLLIYLLSQKQSLNGGYSQSDFLLEDEKFNRNARGVVKEFIEIVENAIGVDLLDDEVLFDNLLLHIKPTIYRLIFEIKLDNPLVNDIKAKYSEVFAACKMASKVIERETEKTVNDDEISYLALHIGAAIEKNKKLENKNVYKVLVVCPEGNGTSSILYYRLLNSFPNIQIDSTCSVTELNRINKNGIDLIVSTVPIYTGNQYNVINVNPLLHEKDIDNIAKIMKRIDMEKNSVASFVVDDIMSIVADYAAIKDYGELKNELIRYFNRENTKNELNDQVNLEEYIEDEFIKLNYDAENWEDAFREAGHILEISGYIEERYIDSMINAAKTYGGYMMLDNGVAFPHAKVTDGSLKTGFSFLTLKYPVNFVDNGRTIPIRMVVCLAADNNLNHVNAMGQLVEMISDRDAIDKITSTKDKTEFKKIVREILGK